MVPIIRLDLRLHIRISFNENLCSRPPVQIQFQILVKSDTTTGALQFVDGMTLFYCDANEDVMIPKASFQVPTHLGYL